MMLIVTSTFAMGVIIAPTRGRNVPLSAWFRVEGYGDHRPYEGSQRAGPVGDEGLNAG